MVMATNRLFQPILYLRYPHQTAKYSVSSSQSYLGSIHSSEFSIPLRIAPINRAINLQVDQLMSNGSVYINSPNNYFTLALIIKIGRMALLNTKILIILLNTMLQKINYLNFNIFKEIFHFLAIYT